MGVPRQGGGLITDLIWSKRSRATRVLWVLSEFLSAVAAVITAVGIPLVGWFSYLSVKAGRETKAGIHEVHGIVNSANDALVVEAKRQAVRIEDLVLALSDAGIQIPPPPPL